MTNTVTIKPEDVKKLREQTGAGIMDCKRALESAGGDYEKAALWLREKGLASAAKKAGRAAREGLVTSYIHHGSRLGVLLELNCETDFVARTDDFQQLARDLAIQVAGMAPTHVSREDVPAELIEEQKRLFAVDAERDGRPADRVPTIGGGRQKKCLGSFSLRNQPYRAPAHRLADLTKKRAALGGENIG